MASRLTPEDALELVKDEKSFLVFLDALGRDFADERAKEAKHPSSGYGPGANGWENGRIDTFLDAAVAWGEASKQGLQFHDVPNNPWKRCADIIYMGKVYE